ncbi:hypothetical protein [Salinispira pacifica]
MNPIDDINSRIQEITNRIREIQSLGRRPPGNGPATSAASGSAPASAGGNGRTGLDGASAPGAADTAGFQSLLEQALTQSTASSGTENASSDGLGLSGLGNLSSIDTLLGNGSSQTGSMLSTDNSAKLAEYQKLLQAAIQELRTARNQGPNQ